MLRTSGVDESDGRVGYSVCFWIGRLGFDSESRKTNDLKINIYSFLA